MRRITLLMWVVFLLPFLSEGQEITYKISSKKNTSPSVVISNNTGKVTDVAFLLKDYFFLSDSLLVEYINNLEVPEPLNRDYRKAWFFMVNYTWSARVPLAKRSQMNDGLAFINSLGWGFCGIKSQMLAWIWEKMGYDSRVWDLNGHIVPELFVDGHWEVWDPTYHVFYPGNGGIPLGVDSLAAFPEMVFQPNDPFGLEKNFWMKMMGYTRNLAEMYATKSDNIMLEMEIIWPEGSQSQVFALPPQARMIMPVYSGIPLWSDFHGEPQRLYDYAECAVYIHSGFTGTVQLPLVLHAISSDGATVVLSGNPIVFNGQHRCEVQAGYQGQTSIDIIENKSGLWLYYLVNPQLINRKPGMESISLGRIAEGITVESATLSARNRVNVILLSDFQSGFHLHKFGKAFFRWVSAKN